MLLTEQLAVTASARKADSELIRISRRVFSFPVVLCALLVVLTVLTVRARFNDPDLWWHLKVGEIVWNTHTIPTTDLFSFTTNNHPWIPHEWLSEVLIYGAYKVGGYTGLMTWLCVFPSLLIIAAYTLSSLYSGNAKVALLGALATWLFATVGLAIRPHIIGYLLLTCELLIVHLGRTRDRRWFLLLPPMFAVWVNCHGSFFFGLAVLAVFLFCSFLDFRIGSLVCTRWDTRQRKMLAVVFALSVAALFINPVGLKQATYPIDVMTNQTTGLTAVDEWQPLKFDNPRDFAVLGFAGLLFLITLLRRTDMHLEELLIVGAGFGLAVLHTRMIFVFGIVAAPVLCRLLSDTWEKYDPARDRRLPNLVMMVLSLIAIGMGFPRLNELEQQVRQGNPVKAVEFLRSSGMSGRMLNEYVYGGYLIWSAPEHKVFIDGRADVYDWTGVLQDYGAWATLQQEPEVLLKKYKIDFCLLQRQSPMSRVLPYIPGWKMVYSDDVSNIFAKVR